MLSTYRDKLSLMMQDNTGMLTEGTYDTCLYDAVVQYSKRHPQQSVIDLTVEQDTYYLSLPEDWETDYSKIIKIIEIVDEETFSTLEPFTWGLFDSPVLTQILRKDGYKWQARYTYRISYTVAHILSGEECTIPEYHQDAILAYAASQLCLFLAAYTAQNADMTLNGATLDRSKHTPESEQWLELAKEYFSQWKHTMGITDTPQTPPAITSIYWKSPDRGSLFHG